MIEMLKNLFTFLSNLSEPLRKLLNLIAAALTKSPTESEQSDRKTAEENTASEQKSGRPSE